MATPDIWHIGLVVGDANEAVPELARILQVDFNPVAEQSFGPHKLRNSFAAAGPPGFEVISGEPGSPWDGSAEPRLDHLAYWVDDIDVERRRLEAAGCPVVVDGQALGLPLNFHELPATGLRLEAIGTDFKEPLRQGLGTDDVEGGWRAGGPWQLGFFVDDMEGARDELTRALGLEWSPVLERGEGTLEVCISRQGPPFYELILARPGNRLAAAPGRRFDHLAYWADDLETEGARLDAAGAPKILEMRPGEICFHAGRASSLRIELMAGAYRDTVRRGWDLTDVG